MAGDEIALVEQVADIELGDQRSEPLPGHGVDRGVGRQGDGVAGVGEAVADIVGAGPEAVASADIPVPSPSIFLMCLPRLSIP